MLESGAVLLYNTLNQECLIFENLSILEFVKDVIANDNVIEISIYSDDFSDAIVNFINQTRLKFMSDTILVEDSLSKPIVLKYNPVVLQEMGRSKDKISKDILYNLSELTLYINSSCSANCRGCESYYKQFVSCKKGACDAEIDFSLFCSLLNQVKESSLVKLNIVGGNILKYKKISNLIEVLNEYKFKRNYIINIKHLDDMLFDWSSFCNSFNSISLICDDIDCLEKVKATILDFEKFNLNYTLCLLIFSDADYLFYENDFRLKKNIVLQYIPIYLEYNILFFQQNCFFDFNEIISQKLSMKEIHRNYLLNNFSFGNFFIFPTGDVYTNLNLEPIGSIINELFSELIFKELEHSTSWLSVRRNQKPCKNCLFSSLCPPLSNYERLLNRNNLCSIDLNSMKLH